ncbi:TlpA family protein disulfide reductase [Salipaludibacillus sp. HK11]|uniref:TlpA family protein disulfide reductase n=1 Tax=Salipaludibacillus sp. HK11 TaxID=3394320 RepID=UPI0039FC25C5
MLYKRKVISIIILLVAFAAIFFTIYDNYYRGNNNEELLANYLDNDGIDLIEEESIYKEVDSAGSVPGKFAHDLEVETWDGESLEISDFKGEFLIINFWTSWCSPCLKKLPDLIDFHENNKNADISILSINITGLERNLDDVYAVIEDFNIPFPTGVDHSKQFEEKYNLHSTPTTFIIDPEGRISDIRIGYFQSEEMYQLIADARDRYSN